MKKYSTLLLILLVITLPLWLLPLTIWDSVRG